MILDRAACLSCGLCADSCPQQAIAMENGHPVFNENCIQCGLCADSCPAEALKRPETAAAKADNTVLVVVEQSNGRVEEVSLALIAKAQAMTGQCAALLCGPCPESAAQTLINCGADTVFFAPDERLVYPEEGLYTALVCALVEKLAPAALLIGATPFGRSIAPRIAARLHTGLTADCTALSIEEETGLLLQTRPAFGGNLMATIRCAAARPQMATVRPGVFPVPALAGPRTGRVETLETPAEAQPFYQVLTRAQGAQEDGLAKAEIIVTVGRGIGIRKNMALAYRLAELLGAQVGVTRPLVDAGWATTQQQIGQTGCSVSPKLLIAVGVSGAIQHLSGMTGAKTVVAINSDPDAPIFSVTDFGIVGVCEDVLPQLIEALSK
ncbi:MAG: electron transfer flavoprotein subunit alpha [Clostridia bacterium]|nr:electron transfer flavoprotein subunit alpha [Clostridia bacterium]